ncbi:alpha-(1,3)-fucosyltransferase 10 isoform X2 [Tribolium castaneum]|uniref:alpha-(1,3)-fucosyltransferase 10 isoform X2 n=1 Tax=Tribolium castaneum TaxID=7070 RepID=UPI00077DACF2|nr:PREDICTED: alpha-(1,3)-fucosyltransferase 10 isoform X2 [Tribolium castaneum]|eukprot:XP_015834537.1 PREDICTED: alpha-(1,3)-fucosyltransferase 10 isoform X2 [Tribolium castaneum]
MLGYIQKLKIKKIFCIILASGTSFYLLQYPIIMWWTPFMGENERITACPNHNCILTKDRKYLNNTNLQAFLFYGSKFNISDLPKRKDTVWALFHEESPRNVALFLHKRTFEVFDIAATFSRHSDFPLTLQYLEKLSLLTDLQYFMDVKEKNKLLNSIAPVLYIQSDCDTPIERDNYVKELMKYIKVDSFGKCLKNKEFPPQVSEIYSLDLYNEQLLHFIAKYKFVIAFENAICDDYITEKLWRPLIAGSVPVYLGSPTVEDWLPNKNSAILAKNFHSPADLATHITKINDDDFLYEMYQGHKFGEIENSFLKSVLARGPFGIATDQEHPISAFECFVCEQIHEGFEKRVSDSVYNCQRPNPGNSWEYFWQLGDCQSRALVNFVKNGEMIEQEVC